MNTLKADTKLLFGGSSGWAANDWTSSDDRVRGGASQSYFSCSPRDPIAKFYGHLDIETLGGAGFASQRTANDELSFDLSGYDGIQLTVAGADANTYTLILKDTLLPTSENGREQASVSWESDFGVHCPFNTGSSLLIRAPFSEFKPTYRGREMRDAKPLDKTSIRRLSLMIRSFFGTQKGDFSFAIESVSAYKGKTELWQDWKPTKKEQKSLAALTKGLDKLDAFPYPYRDRELLEYKSSDVTDEKHWRQSRTSSWPCWFCRLCC